MSRNNKKNYNYKELNNMENKGLVNTIGYHYVVEASKCDKELLSDIDKIREIFIRAAKESGMNIKITHFFKFAPEGVSGVVVVSESHLSIHTWPEKAYAAIDVYTCGGSKPEKAVDYIIKALKCKHAHISEIKRGIDEDNDLEFTHYINTWEDDLS